MFHRCDAITRQPQTGAQEKSPYQSNPVRGMKSTRSRSSLGFSLGCHALGFNSGHGERYYSRMNASASANPAVDRATRAPSVRVRALQLGLLVGCLLVGVAATAHQMRWRSERDALLTAVRDNSLATGPENALNQRIAHEGTPHHAQLLVARALIHAVLECACPDPAIHVDKVRAAARLAREVLAAQPNSWQAAMLLGAATYLERTLTRDRRLFTAAADWEAPLEKAMREAPGKAEPRRFLVAAYLEVWRNLSSAKKARTRELITAAFHEDEASFARLLPAWLEIPQSLAEAFAPIPDRPEVWHEISRTFAKREEWARVGLIEERYRVALERHLQARLAEAEARLRLGDLYNGRAILLRVIVEAPPERRFAPLVTRALEQYPPGLHGLSSTLPLENWLDWVLTLHRLATPLPVGVVSRLAGAIDRLDPPRAALAALIAGEVRQAEQQEQLAPSLSLPAWAPYVIAKAEWHLERRELAQASLLLDRVDELSRRELPRYWLVRKQLARAQADPRGLELAERELAALRAHEWGPLAWRWHHPKASLLFLPAAAAEQLSFEFPDAPAQGAVIALRLDGETLAILPVQRGKTLTIKSNISPELHLLELETLAGRAVHPGRVRLAAL